MDNSSQLLSSIKRDVGLVTLVAFAVAPPISFVNITWSPGFCQRSSNTRRSTFSRKIPRAALLADEIAEEAEFFSFGTNDLTQMTFGFSRDDAGKFLESYYENKIYESDPFAKLDQKGVGQLIEMAAKKGKATRPDIHLGICGEHGGDPSSVEFCYRAGLDYVSCSPFRVPIARLAAAQAVLKDK